MPSAVPPAMRARADGALDRILATLLALRTGPAPP